jgi:pyruvate/2-oxoglutarate dehydrogenase complex dihydrolipoamide dehydrogenase (E3) component
VPDAEKYEILVLGSGEAGKYLASSMAKASPRTAMVERRWLSGSCPNIACLPSKNLIYSATVAPLISEGLVFLLGQVDSRKG